MINLNAQYIAIDTETTGLIPWGDFERWGFFPARPFAFPFYDCEGNKEYLRGAVNPFTREVTIEKSMRKRIQAILSCPAEKVFYNANFDIRMLEMSKFSISGKIHDAHILMHIITGGSEMSYELKPIAEKFAGISNRDEVKLHESARLGRRKGRKLKWCLAEDMEADYWTADPALCEKYAMLDAKRTMILFLLAKEEIEQDTDLALVYKREMRLRPIVKRMEDKGARVLPKALKKLGIFYKDYMKEQRAKADKLGGKGINFNSPPQMGKLFYKDRGYEVKEFTEKGNPKLDASVLAGFALKDPLAKAILEWKAAAHAMSSFLNPYERFKVREEETGHWVLHGGWRQCGPVTGRFKCSDPNLMNVASPDGVKKKADIELLPREVFGPRKDHVLYMPDFSQVEIWVFASLAKDQSMLEALLSGEDIHGQMARKVWGEEKDWTKNYSKYRARAKFLTWCKFYGGGIKAIAEQLGTEHDEAKQYSDEYDEAFPGVRAYIKKTSNLAEEQGWVKNVYGRKYLIDSHFGYKAVNYLVQGTVADIVKTAMINVSKEMSLIEIAPEILLTLHDELGIESHLQNHSKRLMRQIIEAMQRGHSEKLGLEVPLPISMALVTECWNKPIELCNKHLEKIEDKDKKECSKKGCN